MSNLWVDYFYEVEPNNMKQQQLHYQYGLITPGNSICRVFTFGSLIESIDGPKCFHNLRISINSKCFFSTPMLSTINKSVHMLNMYKAFQFFDRNEYDLWTTKCGSSSTLLFDIVQFSTQKWILFGLDIRLKLAFHQHRNIIHFGSWNMLSSQMVLSMIIPPSAFFPSKVPNSSTHTLDN